MFADVFGTTNDLTLLQACARAILIFLYGLAIIRVAGRRVFGKWSALDIIVSIIVGSNLSRALTGNAPLLDVLAATTLLMALHWLFAQAAARSPRLSAWIEGAPVELARAGALDRATLLSHSISAGDLNEALRQQGVERVEDTRLVVLEPSGKIAVLKQA